MGFEVYDRAERKYQDEIIQLDYIARYVGLSDRGDFLKYIALAWLKADRSDRRILWTAWSAICTKYRLAEEVDT